VRVRFVMLRATTCGLTKPIEQAGDVLAKLPKK
jgi:hypothetical protein